MPLPTEKKNATMTTKTDRRDWLDTLKRDVTASRIAAALQLRGRGRRFFCPACQASGGKSPDLSLSDTGFRCFKCDAKGDLVALVMLAQDCDFKAAVEWLARETGHPSPIFRPSSDRQPAPRPSTRPVAVRTPQPIETGPSLRRVGELLKASDRNVGAKGIGPIAVPGGYHNQDAPPTLAELGVDRRVILRAFLDGCRDVDGKALAYLTDRGIDAAVVRQLGVRFCGREYPALMEQLIARFGIASVAASGLMTTGTKGPYPTFAPFVSKRVGFLVLPYLQDGQPVYLKARPPLSKADADAKRIVRFLNTGGAVPCLYNVDVLQTDADRVLICEGETDTLTALSHGYAAVGIPGWSHFKPEWAVAFTGKAAYLVLDADTAGARGVVDVARKFERAGLPLPREVRLPAGLDLNEFFQDRRKDGMTS